MSDEPRATAIDQMTHAEAHGSAPAINIVLGSEAMKPIMWFLAVMLAAVLALGIGLAYSIALANAYRDDAITKTQEERLTQDKIESLRREVAEIKARADNRRSP